VAAAPPLEHYERAAHNPFEESGFRYQAEQRGQKIFHRETRLGPDQKPVTAIEVQIAYAIGSGTRARSYLHEREGYLFQSPISWYTEEGVWGLAPGYTPDNNLHFERPILPACLDCHSNRVEPVPLTINHYRLPLFRGYTIGCERCHGPGQLHVQLRERGTAVSGVDYSIVNPRHLDPPLREAVCQQCHLQGQVRVIRRGRQETDYRPGLPLSDFQRVFVSASGLSQSKFAGHAEQMYQSRCFRESAGRLGCISCHDPHVKPSPEEAAAYFRRRCLTCHHDESCRLPVAARREQSREDNCVACHMPRSPTSNIPHATASDHRIPRNAVQATTQPTKQGAVPGQYPLAPFPQRTVDPSDPELLRDLGVALVDRKVPPRARALGQLALPLVEQALEKWPDDLEALDAKGRALWMMERLPEALGVFEACLAKSPGRQFTRSDAVKLAALLGQTDTAIRHLEELIAEAPWDSFYHTMLARLSMQKREWHRAAAECQTAVRLNPAEPETYRLLIVCLLRQGQRDQATTAFQTLLKLSRPTEAESLRRWYGEQGGRD
jgi:hypothetical protein